MDETKQTDDRWRELADLLGIPEEKPGAKSEPAAPVPRPVELPPPAPPRHEPKIQEPEPPPVRPEVEAPPPEPMQEWETASEEDDTDIEEAHVHGEAAVEQLAEPGAPLGEDGEPRRGRRRRRRGRRRGGDRPEGEPHDAAPAKEPEPRGDPAGPREHQGRGRGHERGEEHGRPARSEQEHPKPSDIEEPRAQPVAQDDALLAEDTDFSNWNVPSWQDLIASLYRPER